MYNIRQANFGCSNFISLTTFASTNSVVKIQQQICHCASRSCRNRSRAPMHDLCVFNSTSSLFPVAYMYKEIMLFYPTLKYRTNITSEEDMYCFRLLSFRNIVSRLERSCAVNTGVLLICHTPGFPYDA